MKVPIEELALLIEEYASNKGAYFSPSGTSMLPTLKNGDKVFLIKRKVQKNDIVFYRNGKAGFTMHRAIKIYNDYFVARGDNQFWTENIPYTDVIAVVDHYFRGKRHISCNSLIFKINTFLLPIKRVLRRIARKLKIFNIA